MSVYGQKKLKNVILKNNKHFILFILINLLISCSSQIDINDQINQSYGAKFCNSKKSKATFIKDNRKKLLSLFKFNDSLTSNKYYIIENYNTLFTPYSFMAGIKSEGKPRFSYFIFDKKSKNLIIYKKSYYVTDAYYSYIYDLAVNNKYDDLKKMADTREMSDAGIIFLHILEKKDNKIKLLKTLMCNDFALTSSEIELYLRKNYLDYE